MRVRVHQLHYERVSGRPCALPDIHFLKATLVHTVARIVEPASRCAARHASNPRNCAFLAPGPATSASARSGRPSTATTCYGP